ncbi:hypothetical protein C814_02440 [Anaerotruncus sp. G3(2012)]|uniref:hypothetical protein n=1 Tax=Anaerotruncus sp. G3(2012) TaxID=1235835 RepID=UPI0003371B89|nr:hypothetical protein [Anaerotruncus sp. G3(2012)]EOS58198.1 hypothetical protein C814_02440 [Anaerotruncus sp. G3(2012)]
MKNYRDKELKGYVIATILIYFIAVNGINSIIDKENPNVLQLIANLLNISIVSSSIYAFVFALDSFYGSDLKRRLVFLLTSEPGQTIFDTIKKVKNDMRFSNADVEKYYENIYSQMPQDKRERSAFQNQQWYHIYHQHRDVEMITTSAKDFRLCRDIFISSINILIIYVLLCKTSKTVEFNACYIKFLVLMIIISNIATRNKGKKWVYNVIAYDISEKIAKDNKGA